MRWTRGEPGYCEPLFPVSRETLAPGSSSDLSFSLCDLINLLVYKRIWICFDFLQDIPSLTAEAAKEHPGVKYIVTAPLGLHELLVVWYPFPFPLFFEKISISPCNVDSFLFLQIAFISLMISVHENFFSRAFRFVLIGCERTLKLGLWLCRMSSMTGLNTA